MDINQADRIYEFPLDSRIRYFLRCESLARALESHIKQGNVANTNIESLRLFFELMELTKNIDLKSETMQHIRWQIQELQKLDQHLHINQRNLHNLIEKKEALLEVLENISLPTLNYQDHYFLNTVKRRLGIPGGICSFDIPLLTTWMQLPHEKQMRDIREWYCPFLDLCTGIFNCLELSRSNDEFREHYAEGGFYSRNFDSSKPSYRLLRIKMDQAAPIYPEVSAGKPRFTIHFFQIDNLAVRPRQVKNKVRFKIALCRF